MDQREHRTAPLGPPPAFHLLAKPAGAKAWRTRSRVWVSWLSPSKARYSHCTGMITPSVPATSPFRGAQSLLSRVEKLSPSRWLSSWACRRRIACV